MIYVLIVLCLLLPIITIYIDFMIKFGDKNSNLVLGTIVIALALLGIIILWWGNGGI